MNAFHSFYKNKRVLVTGGAGFIGSHIAEALVSYGAAVTILDNLSTGTFDNLHAIQKNITFIEGDIQDAQTCMRACNNQEVIFHCAALVSVPEGEEHKLTCHAINATGTLTLLEAARLGGASYFIFSSSSAVYGNEQKTHRETDAVDPISCYGASKLIGEYYCRLYAHYGMNTLSLRYFNVYGPRQRADSPYAGVVARFTSLLMQEQPLTLYGNGHQTRDFIPVQDVAYHNLAAPLLEKNYLQGDVVNIASGKSITLLTLIKQLEEVTGKQATLVFEPARRGDVAHSAADCTRKNIFFQRFKDQSQ